MRHMNKEYRIKKVIGRELKCKGPASIYSISLQSRYSESKDRYFYATCLSYKEFKEIADEFKSQLERDRDSFEFIAAFETKNVDKVVPLEDLTALEYTY